MLHKTQTLQEEDVRLIESDALRSILTHTVSNNGSQYESSDPVQESVTALKDCVFFDIETTGLSADTAFIFLIGCICYDGHSWILHQFLIQVVQEESLLLSSFSHLVNQYRHLIHFNGTTFDLPFIQKRTVANSLEPLLIKMNSLDLYQYFRKLKTILNLSHMNQSALEKYTGWEREDCLSGKEMVSAFWNYAASKNPDTERLLLLHNRDDPLGMLRIVRLESFLCLLRGEISGIVTAAKSKSEDSQYLSLSFALKLPLVRPIELHSATILQATGSDGQLEVPFFAGTLLHFLPDYRNYYYLPLEKQIIHKSIASFVEKEYRIPAKPENCFVSRTGLFLPVPHQKQTLKYPLFQRSYSSKEYYFEYTDDLCMQTEDLTEYIRLLLQTFGSQKKT